MKRKLSDKRFIFSALFVIGLFFIFFVGWNFNPTTKSRSLSIVSDGLTHFRKGLDVSGGTKLVFKISYDKYESVYQGSELTAVKKMIETIILKNIDNRISGLGVSDYKAYVQTMDNKPYIVVEIGGIADLDQAKEIIGKTVELEFRLPNTEEPTLATKRARKNIAQTLKSEIEKNGGEFDKFADARGSENIFYSHYPKVVASQLPSIFKKTPSLLNDIKTGTISRIITDIYDTIDYKDQSGAVQTNDVYGYTFYRINDRQEVNIGTGDEKVWVYDLEAVFVQDKETWKIAKTKAGDILNGAYFKYANVGQSQLGQPVVAINFDDKGKGVFCDITSDNIGTQMAIFVGGELKTSPVIRSKICGGTAQIDGSFTPDSAKELVDNLNDGALPAPLVLMQEEKINPTLGVNALTGALVAAGVGILAIFLLILSMYGWRKAIVTLGVLVSFMVVLGFFMKLVDYALSLSGIAAVVLSIGMAVDANILIYERIKEEQDKGKTLFSAIETAYDRSRPAIRDGNISTGLIALLLFMLGSNMFKGFGTMLIVTVLLTLFVNVPLTKILLKTAYKAK